MLETKLSYWVLLPICTSSERSHESSLSQMEVFHAKNLPPDTNETLNSISYAVENLLQNCCCIHYCAISIRYNLYTSTTQYMISGSQYSNDMNRLGFFAFVPCKFAKEMFLTTSAARAGSPIAKTNLFHR